MKHKLLHTFAVIVALSMILGACATPTTEAPKPTAAAAQPTVAPAKPTAAPVSKYKESPLLAEQVKAGKLPAVDLRLPEKPLVVDVIDGVGQYGGTWRRGFTGPSDFNNYVRVVYDALARYSPDGSKIEPKIAESWTNSADFKTWTIKLRKGAKWSDGSPMTADDVMFWYTDVLSNKDLIPSPHKWMKNKDGSLAKVEKVDEVTVKWTFAEANNLFLNELANQDGGDRTYAPFLPSKYLKQFHATYAKKEDLDKMVADAKFKTWVELFASRNAPFENIARPTMTAWVPSTRISEQVFLLKRNPFFVGVDKEGNQLPYIDEVRFTFYADINALNLAAIAGEMDQQDRHINLMNYPVLKENEQKGKYKIILWPSFGGADAVIMFNQTFKKDADLAKLLQTRDFRIALSYAVDRKQIQESAFLGLGEARNGVAAPWHPFYPGDAVAKKYTEFKADETNKMLDKLGLDKKDADGFRLYPGSTKRVTIELAWVDAFGPWGDAATIVGKNWDKVGVKTIVQKRDRALQFQMRDSNDLQAEIWNEDTGGFPFTGAPKYDVRSNPGLTLGPLMRTWYTSGGKEGVEPTAELKKIVELIDSAKAASPDEQVKIAKELYTLWVDQMYEIGIIGLTPMVQGVAVTNNNLMNVPKQLGNDWPLRTPGNARPEQWYFKK